MKEKKRKKEREGITQKKRDRESEREREKEKEREEYSLAHEVLSPRHSQILSRRMNCTCVFCSHACPTVIFAGLAIATGDA